MDLPENLDYWDLSHEERAALTEAQVQRYIDIELMRQGVVKPQPPTLDEVETPEVPTRAFFRPTCGRHDQLDIAFETSEQAAAFLKLNPMRVKQEWECGDAVYAKPLRGELAFEEIQAATEQDFVNLKERLRKAKATKAANEKAREEFNKEMRASNEVTEGVWEKWRESRAEIHRRETLRAKWQEYVDLCKGDETIAFPFLRKAYSDDQIRAAFGEEKFSDLTAPDVEAAPEPQEDTEA